MVAAPAEAERINSVTSDILNRLDEVGDRVYNQDPYDNSQVELYRRISNIIKIVLSFTGLAAVSLIIYGGFLWMTARGNDDQIANARQTIIASLVGLIIIVASFAITSFVVNILVNRILE